VAKSGGSALKPRRVRSADDRNAGRGSFITIKDGQQFIGYALFAADPALDDNPGYYEYFEHYTPATGYVPCSGDGCWLCEEGDQANTRAKSVWLIVSNDDLDPDNGTIKVFNMNWSVIQEFAEDGADALGSLYRIKALAKKGSFSIRPKTEHLTKKQVATLLKDKAFPNLEAMVVKSLRRAMEEQEVGEAMQEDDDDEPTTDDEPVKGKGKSSTARKGKPKDEEPEEPEASDEFDPEEDDEFEGNVTVLKVTKKDNIAHVSAGDVEFDLFGTDDVDLTAYKKGDEFHATAEKDNEGDFVVSEVGEAQEEGETPGDEAEVPDSVENEKVTIVSVNSDEDTLTIAMEDETEFELFFLDEGEDDNGKDWAEFDLDDFSEGQTITISAEKDQDGDMLASVFPEAEKAKGKGKGKGKGKAKSKA
jgi:hypothetical protein